MFLSILIPVYNAEKYIAECLDSCLDQDIEPSDYEIICINDGSTDNSLAILRQYAEKHPNIKVVDQPNAGVSTARNNAMAIAHGDYFWFVDADDMIKENCLRALFKLAESNYDLINFASYSFNEKFSPNGCALLKANNLVGNVTCQNVIWTRLYKSSIIKNNHLFFYPGLTYSEDEVFHNDILQYADHIFDTNDVLYLYRQHANSAMNLLQDSARQKKRIESIILAMSILKTGIENGTYTKPSSIIFLKICYNRCLRALYSFDRITSKYYFKKMTFAGLLEADGILTSKNIVDVTAFVRAVRVDLLKRNKIIKKLFPIVKAISCRLHK